MDFEFQVTLGTLSIIEVIHEHCKDGEGCLNFLALITHILNKMSHFDCLKNGLPISSKVASVYGIRGGSRKKKKVQQKFLKKKKWFRENLIPV